MHRQVRTFIFLALSTPPCWYALMAVHALGHVLNAWVSGGRVQTVHLGLFEFSRTDLSINPHPQFVAWGGPTWGCAIPAFLYLATRRFRQIWLPGFFAGLCLVVNGLYIGVGWIDKVGDAGTLIKQGAPIWTLTVTRASAATAGLWLWHRLGRNSK